MRLIITKNYDEMCERAARMLAAQILLKPNSVLGLATGSTPIGVYRNLVDWNRNGEIDFSSIKTVNLDEYYGLNPENNQSYRYFMNNNLFNMVNIDNGQTNVPNGLAEDINKECLRYEEKINELGGIDIQLLGIGNNGHIGFNEPHDSFDTMTHSVTLTQSTIDANARFFASKDEVPKQAITMGIGTIMKAKRVLLIANGKAKADIIYDTCFGPVTPQVPASILQLHPDATIIVDDDAYSKVAQM